MATPDAPPTGSATGSASVLLVPLLDGRERDLVEVARTRVSVHYETGDLAAPALTVCTPAAIRLPDSLVTGILPVPGTRLTSRSLRVVRWWRPARPTLAGADRVSLTSAAQGLGGPQYDDLSPTGLVGNGPGLTPRGDDVLAGALVTAHALGDARWHRWRAETLALLHRTTAVSAALLRHAADGYAIPPLADLLAALATGRGLEPAVQRLLRVGHTSGAALLDGVAYVATTTGKRAAA